MKKEILTVTILAERLTSFLLNDGNNRHYWRPPNRIQVRSKQHCKDIVNSRHKKTPEVFNNGGF